MRRLLLFLPKLKLNDTLAEHRRALAIIQESGREWVAVWPMALALTNASR
jgi:hypothetical protein